MLKFHNIKEKDTAKPIVSKLVNFSLGKVLLAANIDGLTHLKLNEQSLNLASSDEPQRALADEHIENASVQLNEYFDGLRNEFDLSLAPHGTDFQMQVWQALLKVPFGETASYSDIAEHIKRPKAVRAVGAANGANPIAIIVPCHRIIGKSGQLTGYAYGVEIKRTLLQLEGH
ncbi:methylated-DNA--[protein]-cysteine S-methyltransferase [Parashewanella curva]|uniref:Methylated-DNA--protein-cysteine methyltransferase n=1 Tax=Parashewanella curva TaxID=2338552 RepID=A0A3L8PY66_9GAMM|nr:methylated-DNA--[protein]-cysteine S-methyltransferase [Parashewanella curva]RLV60366.1 methylated-DNA--[protein]-cysteine S-methyltransferase [Parashewanella curva]